jgi:hypothetical protein
MFDLLLLCFLPLTAVSDRGVQPAPRLDLSRFDEARLKKEHEKWIASLKPQDFTRRHPRVVEALRSQQPKLMVEAMAGIGQTGDLDALPLLLPHLESQDTLVAIWAGSAVSQLVERHALRRRDPKVTDRVVLRPRGQGDPDLRPLAWVVLQMLEKPDDGNTHSYAATMIRYLELREFTPQLRQLTQSRHPAVSDQAKWALESLTSQDAPTK